MFIQVIHGRSTHPDEIRAMTDRWQQEMGPHADGWLGETYGVADDDEFWAVVRFESEEAARANSAKPEQGKWAEQLMKLFDGPVEFHDCSDVTTMLAGGSDDAGFVQIIRGHVDDPAPLKAMMAQTDEMQEARPEIIGGTLAIEPDGTFFQTVAFTDEESARRGEQQEMPDDVRESLESAMRDVSYVDLHHPMFATKG